MHNSEGIHLKDIGKNQMLWLEDDSKITKSNKSRNSKKMFDEIKKGKWKTHKPTQMCVKENDGNTLTDRKKPVLERWNKCIGHTTA